MKFAVLSGAYKNAGDFLIVDRSVKLIKYVYPDCEIKLYERRKSLEPYLDEINECDALIFAGGPAYYPGIYPKEIPLVDDLDRITTKFFAIGLGWFGRFGVEGLNDTIYNKYVFDESSRKLLKRIEQDSVLACRDLLSVRALKNNGFNKALMTGCPAWYNLETIESTGLRAGINSSFKKICISDPANIRNVDQAYKVAEYIKNKYPSAEIHFVFHRGIKADDMTNAHMAEQYQVLAERLKSLGIAIHDISYSKDGFSIYDDCDLHLGFRVHAHIYNLSMRNISILIEEDGRGAGVNEALGLCHIPALRSVEPKPELKNKLAGRILRKLVNKFYTSDMDNPYLIRNIDDYIHVLQCNDHIILRNAFRIQQEYFKVMTEHLKSIRKAE